MSIKLIYFLIINVVTPLVVVGTLIPLPSFGWKIYVDISVSSALLLGTLLAKLLLLGPTKQGAQEQPAHRHDEPDNAEDYDEYLNQDAYLLKYKLRFE